MEQKLFNDGEVFQKERPTELTKSQENDFYFTMAKEVVEGGWSTDDPEDIAKDLENLYPFRDNGFEMAKDLDSHYRNKASYDIDTSFCEWLDELDWEYRKRIDENVLAWVAAHNPQPLFSKGDRLIINKTIHRDLLSSQEIFITGLNKDKAYYTCWKEKEHNGGYIVEYEKLETTCALLPKEPNVEVSDTMKMPREQNDD